MAVARSWENFDEKFSGDLKSLEETASEGGKVHGFYSDRPGKNVILLFSSIKF